MVETACRLVEQQELRPRRERACELDSLQRPERQSRRRRVRELREPERVEGLEHLGANAALAAGRDARVRADEDVVEDAHVRAELQVLEGARDAEPDDAVRRLAQQVLALVADGAAARLVEPRDDVERRRLPGAVRADQAGDLVLLHRQRKLVEGEDAAEASADVVDLEQRHGG